MDFVFAKKYRTKCGNLAFPEMFRQLRNKKLRTLISQKEKEIIFQGNRTTEKMSNKIC